MTPEQRNSIQDTLNSFKSHKIYGRPDWRLSLVEKQSRPLHSVQELYEYYQQTKNLSLVGEKYGLKHGKVHKLFKRHNLEIFGFTTHRSPYELGRRKLSTKHMDTLSMSQSKWNRKYDVESKSVYYRYKKIATKVVGMKS